MDLQTPFGFALRSKTFSRQRYAAVTKLHTKRRRASLYSGMNEDADVIVKIVVSQREICIWINAISVTSSHAAYNVTVDVTTHSARVNWFPAYDAGHPLHYVIWWARPSTCCWIFINRNKQIWLAFHVALLLKLNLHHRATQPTLLQRSKTRLSSYVTYLSLKVCRFVALF